MALAVFMSSHLLDLAFFSVCMLTPESMDVTPSMSALECWLPENIAAALTIKCATALKGVSASEQYLQILCIGPYLLN